MSDPELPLSEPPQDLSATLAQVAAPREDTPPTERHHAGPAPEWSLDNAPVPGYRLTRILGKGGMGEVWEAVGPGGVPTALKRVPIPGGCGERELAALELLKHVRHPHLLALHGYWVLGDLLVIGMELAEESLAALLRRNLKSGARGLPQNQVLEFLQDAAEALDYLGRPIHRVNGHTVRIQHRDVKPANLLVQGGAVKVADFGLAKALKSVCQGASLSMTVAYAPPEFFHGETTPTSDQYSLGVTWCELRTGRLPFVGTAAEVMHGHLQGKPNLEGLTDHERAVVLRALAKDPKSRWAGCVKFIGELARTVPDRFSALPLASRVGASSEQTDPLSPTAAFRGRPVTSGLLLVAGDLVPLPLCRTEIRADIAAGFAEVAVTQVFVNRHGRAVEATYVFPLPEDAAVHRLRLCVGERLTEGTVLEQREASQTYEEAREEGHGAVLMEQRTGNVFTSSVANILPDQEVRVEFRYLQPLPFSEGQYRFVFPMVVPPVARGRESAGSPPAEDVLSAFTDACAAPGIPPRRFAEPGSPHSTAGGTGCAASIPHRTTSTWLRGRTGAGRGPNPASSTDRRDSQPRLRASPATESLGLRLRARRCFRSRARTVSRARFLADHHAAGASDQRPLAARGDPLVIDRSRSMEGRAAPAGLSRLLASATARPGWTPKTPRHQRDLPVRRRGRSSGRAPAVRRGTIPAPRPSFPGAPAGRGRDRDARAAPAGPADAAGPGARAVARGRASDGRLCLQRARTAGRPAPAHRPGSDHGLGDRRCRQPPSARHKLTAAGRGFAEFLFPGENLARAVERTLSRFRHAALTDIELHWDGPVEDVLPERCPDVLRSQPLLVLGRFRGAAVPRLTLHGRLAGEPYSATIAPAGSRPGARLPQRPCEAPADRGLARPHFGAPRL